ncbi:MAG TPA: hypothetical protein VGM94_13025 [Galbitalea sp.]|jgi:Asp/Glu/hydantoin racemase
MVAVEGELLVAVISGVSEAAPPAAESLRDLMPDAKIWNLIDDRIVSDAVSRDEVTPHLADRMARLVEHARLEGAAAVLLTCSVYGTLAQELSTRSGIPVIAPDDDAMAILADSEFASIGVISGVPLALRDSCSRLAAVLASRGSTARVVPLLASSARLPSLALDMTRTLEALSEAIGARAPELDAVFLANYTLSFAAAELSRDMAMPVITGPPAAAAAICQSLVRLQSESPV